MSSNWSRITLYRHCIWAQIGRYFEVKERKSSFLQEMRAGVVAFLTVRSTSISLKWLNCCLPRHADTRDHSSLSCDYRLFQIGLSNFLINHTYPSRSATSFQSMRVSWATVVDPVCLLMTVVWVSVVKSLRNHFSLSLRQITVPVYRISLFIPVYVHDVWKINNRMKKIIYGTLLVSDNGALHISIPSQTSHLWSDNIPLFHSLIATKLLAMPASLTITSPTPVGGPASPTSSATLLRRLALLQCWGLSLWRSWHGCLWLSRRPWESMHTSLVSTKHYWTSVEWPLTPSHVNDAVFSFESATDTVGVWLTLNRMQ